VARLSILLPSHSPITIILIVTLALEVTTTPAITSGLLVRSISWDSASLDVLDLLVTVLLLAHDLQLLAIVGRFGVTLKELLRSLFRVEFHEDTSLERLVLGSTQTHSIRSPILGKELLNIKLCTGLLLTEPLSIDRAGLSTILKHLDLIRIGAVVEGGGEGLTAAHAGVVFAEFEEGAFAHGFDDGGEGLEVAHALEGVQDGELDGVVLTAADFAEEEAVAGEVGVGEVEFDLEGMLGSGWVGVRWMLPVCGSQLGRQTLLVWSSRT
jgi:hypothetical protein